MKKFKRLTKNDKLKLLQDLEIAASIDQRSQDLDQLFSKLPLDQQESVMESVPTNRRRSSIQTQITANHEQQLEYTRLSEIPEKVTRLASTFKSNITLPISFRIQQLRQLHKLLTNEEQALQDALYQDLHKSATESYLTEINIVKSSLSNFIVNLDKFMEPKQDDSKLAVYWGDKVETRRVPWGVVLVIGPWNYPLQLTLGPLAG